jgi:hypothetical protein
MGRAVAIQLGCNTLTINTLTFIYKMVQRMIGKFIGHDEKEGNISKFPEKDANISTLVSTTTSLLSTTSTL